MGLSPRFIVFLFCIALGSSPARAAEKEEGKGNAGKSGDGDINKAATAAKDATKPEIGDTAARAAGLTSSSVGPPSSGVEPNSQLSLSHTTQDTQIYSGRAAASNANAALDTAEHQREQARYEEGVREQLQQDQARVNGVARPLLASPKAADRKRAEEFLSQSTSPPDTYSKVYQILGLDTNRDLMKSAPNYVSNLEKSVPQLEQDAENWQKRGEEAMNAARVMNQFANTLGDRTAKLGSVSPDSSLVTTPVSAAAIQESAFASRGNLTLSGMGEARSGNEARLAMSAGSSTSSTPWSLRDQLRAKLATGAGATSGSRGQPTGDATGAPTSAFDSLFEARSPASASGDNFARGAASYSAFSMAGSETDQAVRKLVQNLDGSQSSADERPYGNPDITIFTRVSKYLTKAQIDKRVAR